jgi:hypothetical protein
MLSFRDVPEGEKLVSEWRLRGVFDKATHEFVGSVAHYNADLRAVLPNATTEELAAWAAEGAAVAAGEPGGEHTAAWEAHQQTALDHRGASWSTQDPRIRSLDPERMPEGRRNDVVGVVAIIELPEAIAGDPAFENLALSVRSDYGVVYQSALSIGTQYAVLWSRSHDAWRVDILEGDELEGITIGTIEPGGARDSDAMLLTISDVQLQGAIVALSTPGADGPSPTHIAVESMTRAQLDQRLAELAQQ